MNLLTVAAPWDYATFTRAYAPTDTPRYSTAAGVRGILVENATYAGAVETLTLPIGAFITAQGTFEVVFSHAHDPASNGRIMTVGDSSAAPFTDDCFVIRRNSTNAKVLQLIVYNLGESTNVIVSCTMTEDIVVDRRYYLAFTWDMAALSVTLTVRDLQNGEWVTASGTLPAALSFTGESYVWLGRGKSPVEVLGNIAIEEVRLSGQDRAVTTLVNGGYQRLALDANTTCLFFVPASGEALAVRSSDDKTVQLSTAAVRPGSRVDRLPQLRGVDSDANAYVYTKGLLRQVSHALTWPRVAATVQTALETLLETHAQGARYPMTWIDHELTPHTVRLDGSRMTLSPVGAGNARLDLALVEEVAL